MEVVKKYVLSCTSFAVTHPAQTTPDQLDFVHKIQFFLQFSTIKQLSNYCITLQTRGSKLAKFSNFTNRVKLLIIHEVSNALKL